MHGLNQAAAEALAATHGGKSSTIIGDDLLKEGYPQVCCHIFSYLAVARLTASTMHKISL
jgi:hypothetical protein